ncbi:MAG: nuclear transport factor 2 family protein [Acidimicrobiia bacterium]
MDNQPDVLLVRHTYEAIQRGDTAALAELLAPNATWHVAGHHPFAGDYRGWAEIADYMAELTRFADTLKIELWDVVVAEAGQSESDAVVVSGLSARRKEVDLETVECDVVSIRAGRIAEVWSFAVDQQSADAFWSAAVAEFPKELVGAYLFG